MENWNTRKSARENVCSQTAGCPPSRGTQPWFQHRCTAVLSVLSAETPGWRTQTATHRIESKSCEDLNRHLVIWSAMELRIPRGPTWRHSSQTNVRYPESLVEWCRWRGKDAKLRNLHTQVLHDWCSWSSAFQFQNEVLDFHHVVYPRIAPCPTRKCNHPVFPNKYPLQRVQQINSNSTLV